MLVTISIHVYTNQFLARFHLFYVSDKHFPLSLEANRYELLVSYFTVQKYHLIKKRTELQPLDTNQ